MVFVLQHQGGWRLVVHDACRVAVPASWQVDDAGGAARGEDGSNVSLRAFHIASWPDHKARIKSIFGRIQTMHEDSDQRLWFEIGDEPRIQHYVDVPHGANVCSALIEMRGATSADAQKTVRRIIDSLRDAFDR